VSADDTLSSFEAGGRIIRGSIWRLASTFAGLLIGVASAAILLRHLGVANSGRYVTVLSLVAITTTASDLGLTSIGIRDLAVRPEPERDGLIANILGVRLVVVPLAVVAAVLFAVIAGYPGSMVLGTALGGAGALLVTIAHSYMARPTVELKNLGWAVLDFSRQLVTLISFALLAAAGAGLTPFFAVLLLTGLVLVALVPFTAGRTAIVRPRFDRPEQRALLRTALPLAAAITVGELYTRIVMVLMSLIANAHQTGLYGASVRATASVADLPGLVIGIAMPLLAATATSDLPRMRYAIEGLTRATIFGGTLVALGTVRLAAPVMADLGGSSFRGSGDVLRIQVAGLIVVSLAKTWESAAIALGRQRELFARNILGLIALGTFAGVLIPLDGAIGGALAGLLGDAVLAALSYRLLYSSTGHVMVSVSFLARMIVAGAIGFVPTLISSLPNLLAAALSGLAFLLAAALLRVIPPEIYDAIRRRRPSTS
jgi:O-antigen/teichoic acid export membrane protein